MPKIKNMGTATMRFKEGTIISGNTAQGDGSYSDYSLVVTGSQIIDATGGGGLTIFKEEADSAFLRFINSDDPSSWFAYFAFDQAENIYLFPGRSQDFLLRTRTNVGSDPVKFPFRVYNDGKAKFEHGQSDSALAAEDLPSDVVFFVSGSSGSDAKAVFGGSVYISGTLHANDAFTSPGPAVFGGNVYVDQYIRHTGDTDTLINFTDDRIDLDAGGVNLLTIEKMSSGPHEVTVNSAQMRLSNTTTDDLLFLEATEDSSSASPVIKLKRNSSSPANADYLGQLKFQGENDADQNVTYAKITGKIGSVTDGSEQGIIEFANMKNGSSGITARLRHDSLQLVNSTNLTVDGDVGIGNTSPNDALDVTGNVRVSNYIRLNCQNTVDPTGSPPLTNHAHIYSKLVNGHAEIFVQDSNSNVTQISPHNPEGEWQYFSRNTKTGKVVKINMEKMIRRLEEITGESFMEEWYEDPTE